jgi:hypothetical protein
MLLDRSVQLDVAPSSLEQLAERLDQRAGAAHRVPHAPLALEVVDHRVDAGGVERVAADEQRVEAEALAQEVVLMYFDT